MLHLSVMRKRMPVIRSRPTHASRLVQLSTGEMVNCTYCILAHCYQTCLGRKRDRKPDSDVDTGGTLHRDKEARCRHLGSAAVEGSRASECTATDTVIAVERGQPARLESPGNIHWQRIPVIMDETSSDAANRLLADMLACSPPLQLRMATAALKIMEEHQKRGLRLHSVVGAGTSCIVISATAELTINSSVPAGTKVALKLSREGQPVEHLRDHSLTREALTTILLETRLQQKEFRLIVPSPVYVWNEKDKGRSFWGYSDPKECSDQVSVLIFACVERIDKCFSDVIKPFQVEWQQTGIIGELFQYTVLRLLFQLAFELRYTAGLAVLDAKSANIGVRDNGHLVVWGLGNAAVFPLQGDSEQRVAALPVPMNLSVTAPWTDSPEGQNVPAKANGRILRGIRHSSTGLFIVANLYATNYCRTLTEKGTGWGRVCKGSFGIADQAAGIWTCRGPLPVDEAYAEDMFQFGRTMLQLMSFNQHNDSIESWEKRACHAARVGVSGIRRLMLSSLDPGVLPKQNSIVSQMSGLLSAVLAPDPKVRMGQTKAMLHAVITLPLHPPIYSIALENGTGIAMSGGGPVESWQVPFRDHPDLKGKTLPPTVLLPQAGMGVGVQVRRALKKNEVAAVYGGEYLAGSDTGRLRRAHPSRYIISTRSAARVPNEDMFLCDAAPSAKRPLAWSIENNNAGPFMNGYEGRGHDINCRLDRGSAWRDENGGVWFVLYANRNIEEGEFLMWNYDWKSGPGVGIEGVTYSFD